MPYLRDRHYSLHFKTNLSTIVENAEEIYENVCAEHLGNNASIACNLCLEYVTAVNEITVNQDRQCDAITRVLHPLKLTEKFIAQRKAGVWKSLLEVKQKGDSLDSGLCRHCSRAKGICLSEAKHGKFGIERALLSRKHPKRSPNLFSCFGISK